MEITLSFDALSEGLTALAAWWGAATGTCVIAWEIHRSRPRIHLSVMSDAVLAGYGELDRSKRYISLTATNRGERATTITNVVGYTYNSRAAKVLHRPPDVSFIVPDPTGSPVPTRLETGATATFLMEKTEDFYELADKQLYMGVHHSLASRPVLRAVKISEANKHTPSERPQVDG